MRWKRIFFDFDGVLCDSRSLAIEYVEELRKRAEFAILPSVRGRGDFGELYRGELRTSLQRFGLNDDQSRRFFDEHAQAMRDHAQDLTLYPGVASGLATLPVGKFSIITSAYGDAVSQILEDSGIDPDPIEIVGHEVRTSKTEKVGISLKEHKVSVDDAVYVGDMESDVKYCDALGLRCIAATYGYHPAEILAEANPLKLVDTPSQIFETLRKGLN